jgi:translation initiation factor IF-2
MIMAQGLVPEEFGGDCQCVPISALEGTNMDALTEAIVTQAELSNLRADPDGKTQESILSCLWRYPSKESDKYNLHVE